MNMPVPSAVPSANITLKEDSSTVSTASGILKTATGEVLVSCTALEGSSSTDALISLALGQIILATQQELLLQSTNVHQLLFLPPEVVELEIQVVDLLVQLEHTETITSEPQETQTQSRSEQTLPQQSSSKQSALSPRSLKPEISDSKQQQALQTPKDSAVRKHSEAPSPETQARASLSQASSSSQRSLPPQESAPERTLLEQQKASSFSPLSQFSAEKQKEALTTSKSHELYKERDQDRQQREQHDRKHDQEEDAESKKKKKKRGLGVEAVAEEPGETLDIAALIFSDQMRPPAEETSKKETTFKKKLPSPMSVFSRFIPSKNPLSVGSSIHGPIQTPKVENVFLRFMKLMARILGQAEAEANELYMRVKQRTDDVDTLTVLISKINNEKKDIDWSENEEMKALLNRAKEIGVTIDKEKYTWTEEEKRLLKENVQMRKENMEKITQMERTDMQRHLQEISQCHQARSNVLKLLKELMDTFIYNLRP
ncbi:conserved hypothetical protein [Chlamydia pneumoniae LPCoLN]|uniref:hypothetical protein n=1 Tax=Chlamydia pneumoniae TaxID=83558 RepID=UPI0001BD9EBA|nr:hypothetical protein [Chlamydia pneumoniae]ACZ32924.1 conserved hypothetical protein [Chlamydia pneumoniae LPCoLN]